MPSAPGQGARLHYQLEGPEDGPVLMLAHPLGADGMAATVPGVLDRWFTRPFQERSPASVARLRAMLLATSPEGHAASCASSIEAAAAFTRAVLDFLGPGPSPAAPP